MKGPLALLGNADKFEVNGIMGPVVSTERLCLLVDTNPNPFS